MTAAGDEVDWAAVRVAYEDGEERVGAILERFGITEMQLRGRRQRQGWLRRPPIAEPRRRGILVRGAMAHARRLDALVSRELERMQVAAAEGRGIALEDARAVLELCRALELMKAMTDAKKLEMAAAKAARARTGAKKTAGEGRGAEADAGIDAARLGAEIKARLDRLRQPPAARRDHRGGDG